MRLLIPALGLSVLAGALSTGPAGAQEPLESRDWPAPAPLAAGAILDSTYMPTLSQIGAGAFGFAAGASIGLLSTALLDDEVLLGGGSTGEAIAAVALVFGGAFFGTAVGVVAIGRSENVKGSFLSALGGAALGFLPGMLLAAPTAGISLAVGAGFGSGYRFNRSVARRAEAPAPAPPEPASLTLEPPSPAAGSASPAPRR